jgi:mono/diheme cytochrome c family protein
MWTMMLVLLVSGMSVAQEVKKVPAKYTTPVSGAEMYKTYCASCHGVDGKGSGPAATALKGKLPDLTQLSKSNAGKFPSDHVAQVIMGDSLVPAHGNKDMPVWGRPFLSMDQGDHSVVMLRIKNLTAHLESIQAK